jgi:transcriptional regulator with XRE-family HTH domain
VTISPTTTHQPQAAPRRSRAQDIDRHIGARLRDRRIMLGLTQQQTAELIGVTYQQLHKYEKGINRIAAGRLHAIAQALGMGVGDFFAGLESSGSPAGPSLQQRALLGLARDFAAISSGRQREALCALARTLAGAGMPPAREDEAA